MGLLLSIFLPSEPCYASDLQSCLVLGGLRDSRLDVSVHIGMNNINPHILLSGRFT